MKIKLFKPHVYDVDIKAYEDGKSNIKELMGFLNEVSLMAHYAAEFKRCQGHDYAAEEYKEVAISLYEICKKAGVYDDIT